MWLLLRIQKLLNDSYQQEGYSKRKSTAFLTQREARQRCWEEAESSAITKHTGMRTDGWEHVAPTALRIPHKKKLPSFTLIPLFYFLFVYGKKKKMCP